MTDPVANPNPLPRKKKQRKNINEENLALDCMPETKNQPELAITEELQEAFLKATGEDETKTNKRLEKLKRSLAINKENDDMIIEANTFHPESNKKKSKNKKDFNKLGTENKAYIDEKEVNITKSKKKSIQETEFIDNINESLTNKEEKNIREDSVDIQEKKEINQTIKKKKKKKKQKTEEETEPEPSGNICDEYKNILEIIIHRTDRLQPSFNLKHPFVRVHIIDLDTETYVKKSKLQKDCEEPLFKDSNDYLSSIITNPYDFKKNRSVLPVFEEKIIIGEYYEYLTNPDMKIMLLFELMDYDYSEVKGENLSLYNEPEFYNIAWAFLKIRSCNGDLNTGHKMRLQLYKSKHYANCSANQIQVFKWWKMKDWVKYSSTLFVTVRAMDIMEARKLFRDTKVHAKISVKDVLDSNKDIEGLKLIEWSRTPGQNCKIPNSLVLSLTTSRKGCHLLAFSNNGRILACACQIESEYHVLLFEIPSGQLLVRLVGHIKIIYEMDWTKKDEMLLTASADGSARIWCMTNMAQLKLATHSYYVYTAKFHPTDQRIFATGGYEKIVRIWSADTKDNKCQILANLEYHCGLINSLIFNGQGSLLFSADNLGVICFWDIDTSASVYQFSKALKKDETKGVAINSLSLHQNGRNLLIHTRNNKILLLDLRTDSIIRKYYGALNIREFIRSTYTPCGSYLLSGSEDGLVYVWNSETAEQVGIYSQLGFRSTVTGLSFHPLDHIVAFSCLGESQPVKIYKYIVEGIENVGMKSITKWKLNSSTNIDDLYEEDFKKMMNTMSLADSIRVQNMQDKLAEITSAGYYKTPTNNEDKKLDQTFTFTSNREFEMLITATNKQKAIVSFKDERTNNDTSELKVLYSYTARRSDELNLVRGQTLRLLFKDSDSWWLAETASGDQGFVPANYVKMLEERQDKPLETEVDGNTSN